MKVVIVGGVAGGASCAASIDPKARTVTLRDVTSGATKVEPYDRLVLSPGATSVRPPLPGIDLPGIFHVRTVPDARAIRSHVAKVTKPDGRRAVVIGGGFIGLEMVENLVHLGFDVTLIEQLDQVLAPLDVEQARLVENLLRKNKVTLALGEGVSGFKAGAGGTIEVGTKSGTRYPADIVILALGVRPDAALARTAGIALGGRGGIKVDAQTRTSDPHIYAVGDAVEVTDVVTGTPGLLALAGPANRQGRIAADAIAGRSSRFRGVQGTAILGLFGTAVGWTGASEKTLRALGRDDYEKVYLYPNHHARYYPGARPIAMKLLFAKGDGRILGAQAMGEEGVDKRIDVIATLIQKQGTVYDLEEAELCYAPQFGSAKDAVNFAGMIAANVLRGDMPVAHWTAGDAGFLLDVRERAEVAAQPVTAPSTFR